MLCLAGCILLLFIVFYDERYFDSSYRNCLPPGSGTIDPVPTYSLDDLPDMINRIQSPPAANIHYPINALGRFGAKAESALPALEHVAESHEYRPIRKYAMRAVRRIKDDLAKRGQMTQ